MRAHPSVLNADTARWHDSLPVDCTRIPKDSAVVERVETADLTLHTDQRISRFFGDVENQGQVNRTSAGRLLVCVQIWPSYSSKLVIRRVRKALGHSREDQQGTTSET